MEGNYLYRSKYIQLINIYCSREVHALLLLWSRRKNGRMESRNRTFDEAHNSERNRLLLAIAQLHKSTIVITIFYLCVCLLQLLTRPPSVLLSSVSELLLHLLGYPILKCFSDWGYRESCVTGQNRSEYEMGRTRICIRKL